MAGLNAQFFDATVLQNVPPRLYLLRIYRGKLW